MDHASIEAILNQLKKTIGVTKDRVRVAQLEAEMHELPGLGGRYDQSGQTA